MKKTVGGLLSLMLVMAVFTACGSSKKSDFVITTEPPSSYQGYSIRIVVENEQEMESVHLEYPKGTITPMDRVDIPTWEIKFNLPQDITGKINLGIIGKPKDGSSTITQSVEYEIMENPTIIAKVLSENPDGAELEVKTSKPFKKVYIQTDNNKQINFESKNGNTYKLKTKELDLDNKSYTVNLEDESGNFLKTNLIYTPDGVVPMMYNYRYSNDPNTFEITEYYGENPRDNPYKKLKIAQKKDLFMDSLPKEMLINSYVSPRYLSMSPSKKQLLMNTIRYAEFSKNYSDSSGQILKSVKAVYSTLYDLETGKYEFIGEPYYFKEYKNPRSVLVFREEGPLYYFMRWEGDSLFLLEQRKDPRMMYDEGEGSNVQDGQSTLASARIVSYSITKKTITVTNQKPVTPWLIFSDQWTGIQGWGLANEKRALITPSLPSFLTNENDSTNVYFLSSIGSSLIFDIRKYFPSKKNEYFLERTKISHLGFDKNEIFAFITALYIGGPSEGERYFILNAYKFFPKNGKLEELCTYTHNDQPQDKDTKYDPYYLHDSCLKNYCKYFTVKDGKIISKYRCDKYINPIESIRYIN